MNKRMKPDVVVGAGPAGSATAYHLARAGVRTLLIDKSDFPRDKVCGDCLSPRAQQGLQRMGLLEAVTAEARRAARIRFQAPGGAALRTAISGAGSLPDCTLVLRRRRFDHLLQRQSLAAGAVFQVAQVRHLATDPRTPSSRGCSIDSSARQARPALLDRLIQVCFGAAPPCVAEPLGNHRAAAVEADQGPRARSRCGD